MTTRTAPRRDDPLRYNKRRLRLVYTQAWWEVSFNTADGMSSASERFVFKVFLFTDLLGSLDLKQRLGDVAGARAIARHKEVFRKCLVRFSGAEQDSAGDGFFATFDVPSHAVECALSFQRELADLEGTERLLSRVGIHMGQIVSLSEGSEADAPRALYGVAVDTAARVMSLSEPGQILLTRQAFDSVRQFVERAADGSAVEWLAHGPYRVTGIEESVEIFEVGIPDLSPLRPPRDSAKARRAVPPGEENALGWRPAVGQAIPGLASWILERKLGEGGFGEAWVRAHQRTENRHVFKFCFDPERLRALKREVTLLRLLKRTLGDRPDIARLLDWQLDEPPYYLESQYAEGGDLPTWAEQCGGLGSVPLETRIDLVAQTAVALGEAHAVGVLHNDIKPSNLLIATDALGEPSIRLADFGVGLILEAGAPDGVTLQGFTAEEKASDSGAGTRLYMAPERLAGEPPKTFSDLYSLGVVLYQMVVGDLRRPLAIGWEREVGEELLREDIAACVDGDPAQRLHDALELASRLRNLPHRRAERERERAARAEEERARAEAVHERRRRERNRYRTAVALMLFSLLGLCAGLLESYRSGTAIEESRRLVVGLVIDANQAAAHWVSEAIRRDLDNAKRLVEAVAQSPELPAGIRSGDGEAIQAFLEQKRAQNPAMFSWAVANVDAVMLGRAPPAPEIVGRAYKYRDWFHGGDTQQRPVPATHISEPFRSTARGNLAMLAVSTPIRAAGEVVGVLLGTLSLQQLADWVQEVPRSVTPELPGDDPAHGMNVVVVANERGQLVLHPNNPLYEIGEPSGWEPLDRLRDGGNVPDRILDPFMGGASFFYGATSITGYDWTVAVLLDTELAEMPLQRLVGHVDEVRWVILALSSIAIFVVAVWIVLLLRGRSPA